MNKKMTKNKTGRKTKKPQPRFFESTNLLIILALVVAIPFMFVFNIASKNSNLNFNWGTLALIAGTIFEYHRLTKKWQETIFIALISSAASFFAFLPGKKEIDYRFQVHFMIWPFMFLLFFLSFALVFHQDKIQKHLTEGITLLQSLAVIYWLVDVEVHSIKFIPLQILLLLIILLTAYCFFHAFTYTQHTKNSKLFLSIWSSIIMLLFAVEHIQSVYHHSITFSASFEDIILTGIQYFLLGISAIYMFSNLHMLIGFIPRRGQGKESYIKEVKKLKLTHIQRYSEEQIMPLYALFCVIYSAIVFGLNLYFDLIPRSSAIWLVFFTFPMIIHYLQTGKNNSV